MPISLTIAIKRYFGLKEGQTLVEFSKEIKALNETDKKEFQALLSAELKEDIEIRY